jgi:fatty acid amide hydrolase
VSAPLTALAGSDLAALLRAGETSAREVVDAHLARIEEVDDRLNAVVVRRFEEARREADAADARRVRGEALGPLHGIPFTVKDQFDLAGSPTTFGVARLNGRIAGRDSAMVAALRAAGAIVLGKTNVPQTLGAWETDNNIFGRTNNPWDLNRTPGGSSGGDAAIVAAGGAPLALGGDYGGSLRVPAAWCGICTIRPTARRLETEAPPVRTSAGAEGLSAQPGPLARSVAEVTAALRVMVDHVVARPGPRTPPAPLADPAQVDVSRLRVALLRQVGDWTPSPAVRRALDEAAEALRAEGATVEDWTDAPDTLEGVLLFYRIIGSDGFAFVSQILDGERPIPLMKPTVQLASMPDPALPLLAQMLETLGQRRAGRMLRHFRRLSARGLFDLLGERIGYEARFLAAMDAGRYDVILCPALPLPAVPHGQTSDLADFAGAALLFNALGLPAGVVPVTRVRPGEESDRTVGRDRTEVVARDAEQGSAGLPVAVQLAARHWREDLVLAAMAAVERRCRLLPGYPARPPLG